MRKNLTFRAKARFEPACTDRRHDWSLKWSQTILGLVCVSSWLWHRPALSLLSLDSASCLRLRSIISCPWADCDRLLLGHHRRCRGAVTSFVTTSHYRCHDTLNVGMLRELFDSLCKSSEDEKTRMANYRISDKSPFRSILSLRLKSTLLNKHNIRTQNPGHIPKMEGF